MRFFCFFLTFRLFARAFFLCEVSSGVGQDSCVGMKPNLIMAKTDEREP